MPLHRPTAMGHAGGAPLQGTLLQTSSWPKLASLCCTVHPSHTAVGMQSASISPIASDSAARSVHLLRVTVCTQLRPGARHHRGKSKHWLQVRTMQTTVRYEIVVMCMVNIVRQESASSKHICGDTLDDSATSACSHPLDNVCCRMVDDQS